MAKRKARKKEVKRKGTAAKGIAKKVRKPAVQKSGRAKKAAEPEDSGGPKGEGSKASRKLGQIVESMSRAGKDRKKLAKLKAQAKELISKLSSKKARKKWKDATRSKNTAGVYTEHRRLSKNKQSIIRNSTIRSAMSAKIAAQRRTAPPSRRRSTRRKKN